MSSRPKGSTRNAAESDSAALVAEYLAFARECREWVDRQESRGAALLERLRAAMPAVPSEIALDGSRSSYSLVGEAENQLGFLLCSEGIGHFSEGVANTPATAAELAEALAERLREHNSDALGLAIRRDDREAVEAMLGRVESGEVSRDAMRAALASVAGYDRQPAN